MTPSDRIINNEKLTIQEASFSTLSGNFGGAVYNGTSGTLTLSGDVFENNDATACGGAIYDEGTIASASDVTFRGNNAIFAGALYTKKSAKLSNIQFEANTATTDGGAIENWGTLSISDSTLNANISQYGGALYNGAGTFTATNCIFSSNTGKDGGAIENYGTLKITDCSFQSNSAKQGGAIDNLGTVTLTNVTFIGNSASVAGGAIYNYASNKVTLNNVSFLTPEDTIVNHGTMSFSGTITLAGALSTDSTISASGVSIVFDISRYAKGSDVSIIENLTRLSGVKDYSLSVADNQATGSYALAGNAAGIGSTLKLQCGEYATKVLAQAETYTYHGGVYQWQVDAGNASVAVAAFEQSGSADLLTWSDINDASSFELELSCGTQTIALNLEAENAELLGLANGDYTWRVRNTAEADNWQNGQSFSQTEALECPKELIASGEAPTALFFAKTDGIWSSGYVARNVLTGETAQLAGKTKITDVFTGGTGEENASILMLDAFGENTARETRSVELAQSGIAFFLDDIYSAAPGSAERARLSNIDTIIASNGNDIIDLTSDRYDLTGNVTILGGAGDDIIWANSGNDVLSGGAGDDILHGGGGNDIFCFGESWGNDTIGQLASAGNSVTLWFSQSSETLNLTFTTQGNDTLITAATGDTIRAVGMSVTIDDCRFCATGYESEYKPLAAAGVFA